MCVFFFKCFSLSLKTHSDTLLSPTGPFPPGTKRFMEYKRGSQEESVKIDMVSIPFFAYCHPPTAWKRGKYHSLSFSFLCFEMSTSHHCSTTAALAALTWRCIHESIIVPNFQQTCQNLPSFVGKTSAQTCWLVWPKIRIKQRFVVSRAIDRAGLRSVQIFVIYKSPRIGCKLLGILDRELDGNLKGEEEQKGKRTRLQLRSEILRRCFKIKGTTALLFNRLNCVH